MDIQKVDQTAEQLLEAMDVIADAKLRSLKIPRIETVSIVDDSEAAQGIYKVSNGSATYIAYSDNSTYRKDDNVQVTIPTDGYNEQKTIIGKVVYKNSPSMTYKDPFDYFLDMTGNLVGKGQGEGSLLANYLEEGSNYKQIAHWTSLDSTTEKPLVGFDILGLSAEFMTQLAAFNTVQGNYGLKVIIKYARESTSSADSVDLVDSTTTNNAATQNNLLTKIFYLDTKDMYGDPYDFDTYYKQQAIFDVSTLGPIVDVAVELFQDDPASFKDKDGVLIPYADEVFEDEIFMDNIYCQDVYLAFGYDEQNFENDKLLLYTRNSNSYSGLNKNVKNKKYIYARWVHKMDTGEILVIDDLNRIPGSTLRWYKFSLNSNGDRFAGLQWDYITPLNSSATVPDGSQHVGYVKEDNIFEFVLIPDTNLEQERIKAILLYDPIEGTEDDFNTVLRSNELLFKNEGEVANVINTRQYEDFYFEFADGSNGIYNLYGNDNKILLAQEANAHADRSNLVRQLNPILIGVPISNIEYIKWTFPYGRNSMIECTSANGLVLVDDNTSLTRTCLNDGNHSYRWNFIDNNNGTASIEYPPTQGNYSTDELYNSEEYNPIEEDFAWYFYYRIKDTYEQAYINNAITCEIVKNRVHYTYTQQMHFGHYGTNGSPYTLSVSFQPLEENKPPETALKAVGDSRVKLQLDLADENGHYLDWNNQSLFGDTIVTWEWLYNSTIETTPDVHYDPVNWINDVNTPAGANGYINSDNIPAFRKVTNDGGFFNSTIGKKEHHLKNINQVYTNDEKTLTQDLSPQYYTYNQNTGVYSLATTYFNSNTVYYTKRTTPKTVDTAKFLYANGDGTANGTKHTSLLISSSNASSVKRNVAYVVAESNILMTHLFAVKITVSNFLPYDLITYVPIPLYKTKTVQGISSAAKPIFIGPNLVRYDSKGDIHFYKDPCRLEWIAANSYLGNVVENNVIFNILTLEVANTEIQNYSSISEKNILRPMAFYEDSWLPHGITAKVGSTIYYTQPIVYYQNEYPNGTVNAWDGVGMIINEEAGYILTHSVVAGKKEDDNTFTGVMLGDIGGSQSNIEDSLSKTGVYGFHHGAISYALLEDGTMYLGKSGSGRIYLDGNESTITSAGFLQENIYNKHSNFLGEAISYSTTTDLFSYGTTLGKGVRLDLDSSPYLYIRGVCQQPAPTQTNPNNTIPVIHDIMMISDEDGQSFIQSASFNEGLNQNGFKLDLNEGTITAFNSFNLLVGPKTFRTQNGVGGFTVPSGQERIRLSTDSPYFILRAKQIIDNTPVLKDLIIFEDNAAYIQSINYAATTYPPLELNESNGLKIDLQNGILDAPGDLTLYGNRDGQNTYQIRFSTISPYLIIRNKSNSNNDSKNLVYIANEKDVNNSTGSRYYLQSVGYNINESSTANGMSFTYGQNQGVRLDLDNGYLDAQGDLTIQASGSGKPTIRFSTISPYFWIQDKCTGTGAPHTLIKIADDEYYLQSCSYSSNTAAAGFKLDLYNKQFNLRGASSGDATKTIIMNGTATNVPFGIGTFADIKEGTIEDILDNSNSGTYSTTTNVFRVDWSGQAVSTRARFAGWQFYEGLKSPLNNISGTDNSVWKTFYTTASWSDSNNNTQNTYSIFDAANQVAIAIGVNTNNAFKTYTTNNITYIPNACANFRVDHNGTLYATKAILGQVLGSTSKGWYVDNNTLYSDGFSSTIEQTPVYQDPNDTTSPIIGYTWTETVGAADTDSNFRLSTINFTRTLNYGDQLTNLRFAIGKNIGITNTGILYAKGANLSNATINTATITNASVSGSITTNWINATGGNIGSWNIHGGALSAGYTSLASNGTITVGGIEISSSSTTGGSINVCGVSLTKEATHGYLNVSSGLVVENGDIRTYNGAIYANKHISASDGIYIGGYGEEDMFLTNTNMIDLKDFIDSYKTHGFAISDAGYAHFA